MRLLTQTIINTLPEMGATSELYAEKIKIHVKFFSIVSPAKWLLAEYDPESRIAYGYADLFGSGTYGGAEWGTFSLEEFESLRFGPICAIERDLHFKPRLFPKCVDNDGRIIV